MTEKTSVDTKEFELPETVVVRDIDNRVFQAIALQCLAKIPGIELPEGTIIDSILGRGPVERVKGIYVEQDSANHSVGFKVEVNICYGVSIPEKAEEIQAKITEEITGLTGLHVSSVHVIFRAVTLSDPAKKLIDQKGDLVHQASLLLEDDSQDEFTDEF